MVDFTSLKAETYNLFISYKFKDKITRCHVNILIFITSAQLLLCQYLMNSTFYYYNITYCLYYYALYNLLLPLQIRPKFHSSFFLVFKTKILLRHMNCHQKLMLSLLREHRSFREIHVVLFFYKRIFLTPKLIFVSFQFSQLS